MGVLARLKERSEEIPRREWERLVDLVTVALGVGAILVFAWLAPATVPVAVALVGAGATYLLSEQAKRRERAWLRLEERYTRLTRALPSFYENGRPDDRQAFIAEWYQGWLYCPDDIVLAGNRFLDAVKQGHGEQEDKERLGSFEDFVIALRRQMRGSTRLTGADFRIVSATRPDGRT